MLYYENIYTTIYLLGNFNSQHSLNTCNCQDMQGIVDLQQLESYQLASTVIQMCSSLPFLLVQYILRCVERDDQHWKKT